MKNTLKIFNHPPESGVKRLLTECRLEESDVTPAHLAHFFGLGSADKLEGVVGLEMCGPAALLRSLAVSAFRRGQGWGSALLMHAEEYAKAHRIESVYLLTQTAAPFFLRHGYLHADRDHAPDLIRQTKEFSELCPVSAIFLVKQV